jgi:cyanophycin synthetase
MMRFEFGGVKVLVDYAHNPDGLRGLLEVARAFAQAAPEGSDCCSVRRVTGRMPTSMHWPGWPRNSTPNLIVVKENEAQLRGRAAGEMPGMIRAALVRSGLPEGALVMAESEVAAARCAFDWARPGDVLALPDPFASGPQYRPGHTGTAEYPTALRRGFFRPYRHLRTTGYGNSVNLIKRSACI